MTTALKEIDDCAEIDFSTITLLHGSHGSTFTGQCCLVEASNRAAACIPELRAKYKAPTKFMDDHKSISRVIRSFSIALNDGIKDDELRTRLLRPYITKILGTATNAADETTRAWMATDWLVRVHAPAFLDLAGLTDDASKLRALTPLTSSEIAIAAQQTITGARQRASAAWDAAWAAARAAARQRLAPTVSALQASAIELLDRMIAVGST